MAHIDIPRAIGSTKELGHFLFETKHCPLVNEMINELASDLTKIYVSAAERPCRREDFTLRTALNEQRRPLSDLRCVFAELHISEEWLLLENLIPATQKINVLLSAHKGHVRGRVNEALRLAQHTSFHQ